MSELVLGPSRVRVDTDAEAAMAGEAWESLKKEVGVEEAASFLKECSTAFGQKVFNAYEFDVCCDLITRFNTLQKKFSSKKRSE